jgi:multiple antibiotic resistance protein
MVLQLLQSIVTFLIVMDPIASMSVFIYLTRKFSSRDKFKAANKAVFVAGALAFVFIFLGEPLLGLMGITFSSFKVAGGIVLFLLGLEMILNFSISQEKAKDYNVAAVIIATPLITGPGVITTSILSVHKIGLVMTSVSALVSLLVTWILLRGAERIHKIFGQNALNIISKIMGLIIASVGINFIISVFGF